MPRDLTRAEGHLVASRVTNTAAARSGSMTNDLSQLAIDVNVVRTSGWAIAALVALFALVRTRRHDRRFGITRIGVGLAIGIFICAWTLPQGLGRVQLGARGIVLRFGAPTGRIVTEGLYAVVPLAERVVQVNTQINTLAIDRAQGVCSDLEPVYANLAVSIHVDPARVIDVYRSLRFDYARRIVRPAIADAWKETVARYPASEIVGRRAEIARELEAGITRRIEHFGIGVDAVATTRVNFAYAYAQAAQRKVAAVQRTLQAESELSRIRIESQQTIVRAKSEIDALRLQQHVPLAQLMKMRQLELQRRAIDKWDGHLPATAATSPFLGSVLEPHHD
jgi:prohibitin 2